MAEQIAKDAEQRGRIEAKLDMLISKVDNMDSTLHSRVDSTDGVVDTLTAEVAHIKGILKAVWGMLTLFGALGGGLFIKVFWG